MKTSEFDFVFPENLIAQHPLPRGKSRMLVVDKAPGDREPVFTETGSLIDYLAPGDALVLNDTKVLRARLLGESAAGGKVEALLLTPRPGAAAGGSGMRWEALVKPAKHFKTGDRAIFSQTLIATVAEVLPDGTRVLEFPLGPEAFYRALETVGHVPLPPYIRRPDIVADAENYQSVFAEKPGSVAAPTASLHLSEAMLEAIRDKGVRICKLTLHVGAGTFRPVQSDDIETHPMHAEIFDLPEDSTAVLNAVRRNGGRIWAVGTTAARVLETCAVGGAENPFRSGSGETRIFIYPGYVWKGVDGLLTNFHWPKSTLFMLVCSLLGLERAKRIYAEAFADGFRLFSYGDAMLIR